MMMSDGILRRVKAVRPLARLGDQAVEQIRAAILGGDLEPGRIYAASELGERLGVSRTPIREAFLELAREGLIEIVKNRGMRVIPTSLDDLLQGFEVRLMLEVPLVERATAVQTELTRAEVEAAYAAFELAADGGDPDQVLRADRDFHRALLAGSGNHKAVQLLQEQRNLVLSGGRATVPHSRSPRECFDDHRDLFDAFVSHDAEAAARAMGRHILNTAQLLIDQERSRRPEFSATSAAEATRRLRSFVR